VSEEDDVEATVRQLADTFGWLSYHTHNSRHSAAGFPDWVLVRGPETIFAELKGSRGRLSPEQRIWLDALDAAGHEVYVWRPKDVDFVVARLGRRKLTAPSVVLPLCRLGRHDECRHPTRCACEHHTAA
jgi:hypothetical protein